MLLYSIVPHFVSSSFIFLFLFPDPSFIYFLRPSYILYISLELAIIQAGLKFPILLQPAKDCRVISICCHALKGLSFFLNIFHNDLSVWGTECVPRHKGKARGQCASLFPPCGVQGSNSYIQTHWPSNLLSFFVV